MHHWLLISFLAVQWPPARPIILWLRHGKFSDPTDDHSETMSFFAADSLSWFDEIQSFGCVSCAATAWLPLYGNSADLAVVLDPNRKENWKKKENKDVAD